MGGMPNDEQLLSNSFMQCDYHMSQRTLKHVWTNFQMPGSHATEGVSVGIGAPVCSDHGLGIARQSC